MVRSEFLIILGLFVLAAGMGIGALSKDEMNQLTGIALVAVGIILQTFGFE